MLAAITENDTSPWEDQTGISYHFPKKYLRLLQPGTEVIYYKGNLKDKKFASSRLAKHAHYFGTAAIGEIRPDTRSGGKNLFATILNFREFENAVAIKAGDGKYLEVIPESRSSNYWRDGVRELSRGEYDRILALSSYKHSGDIKITPGGNTNDLNQGLETVIFGAEGNKKVVIGSVAERDPRLRAAAVQIHGTRCKACGFDFGSFYGEYAAGYIHIHHLRPLAEGLQLVDPSKDMVPVCANCHAIIHRRRDTLLSVERLVEMINEQKAARAAEMTD